MKAPSVAPITASQVLAETVVAARAASVCGRSLLVVGEAALMAGWNAVMGRVLECLQRKNALGGWLR
jgi:hypothetical protein